MLTADYEYTYGEYGEVTKIKNNTENTEISYIDGKTQITLLNGEGEADDTVLYSTETNENGETVEFFGGMSYTQSNGTAVTDSTTGLTTSGSNLVTPCNSYIFGYESDYFGRQTEKTLTTNVRNENSISQDLNFETHYEYKNLGNDKTTALVSSYRTILNMVTKATDAETTTTDISTIRDWEYLYSYDSNGNIIDISVTFSDGDVEVENISICNYVYDEAGQLVRENNMFTEKSYTYVYDKGGNIAQKNEYSYSTEELGEAISTINYTYDSVWKDKLTAYGETAIATDSIGNPLNMVSKTFFGGANSATLEWNGRQLSSATVDGTKYEYTYDSSGLRTRMVIYNKNQPTVSAIYYYIWQNGKMLGYCITDANGVIEHTVKMLFDNNGDTVGYELYAAEDNSTKAYFFHKNLQGDITDAFNENGETVISYYYDSWGNITLNLNSNDRDHLTESTGVALFTPITYRGYCYDYYTGLYYLQSRYYNPTYGRFLNADSIMKTGNLLGTNIFAYCENNPVNFVDFEGTSREKKLTNALMLIGEHATTIVEEASYFGVDPVVVAGVIVAEQTLNYNVIDSVTDWMYFINPSIGIGQVKVSTAISIEKNTMISKVTETPFIFLDQTVWSVPGVGYVSGSYERAIAQRLKNDEQNIKYVAAYISYHQNQWAKAGYDISHRPEILATLYNIGERTPNGNPQSNDFGEFVGEHYEAIAFVLVFCLIIQAIKSR